MFGGAKPKPGMRHLYADMFKKETKVAKLYVPFPNSNCLQCHSGKQRFELIPCTWTSCASCAPTPPPAPNVTTTSIRNRRVSNDLQETFLPP